MSYGPVPMNTKVLDPMASQIHGSRCVRNRTSIHPRLVFTKRAIPVVALRPRPLNLQETRLSNFFHQVQPLPRRHTHATAPHTNPKIYRPVRASTYKRDMTQRTNIPKTSSSTPGSSQQRRNKKTVVPITN